MTDFIELLKQDLSTMMAVQVILFSMLYFILDYCIEDNHYFLGLFTVNIFCLIEIMICL